MYVFCHLLNRGPPSKYGKAIQGNFDKLNVMSQLQTSMEGFDDLLGPSRQALEENPFADPFLKRSSSPDPWANPFASTDSSDAFGSTSEHFAPSEPSNSSSSNDIGSSSSAVVEESPIADPLDSAARAADDDDDNEPLAKLRSPGFRESIPRTFSETATIRPPHDEDLDSPPTKSLTDNEPTIPGHGAPTPEPASTSTAVHAPQSPSRSNPSFSSPPPSATESSFKSPLEAPFGGLNRSMAGVSLDGEAQGGWHSAEVQTPWQAEQVTPIPAKPSQGDDDSDDDRPILQSYHKQHEDKSSVSTLPLLVHNAAQLETPKLAFDAGKN